SRKFGIDSCGDKLRLAVRQRLLKLALNVTVRNSDFGDLALVEELLELAVWNRLDPLHVSINVLNNHQAENGRQPVANMKPGFSLHRSSSGWVLDKIPPLRI